jgi:hypothetical protein
MPRILGRRERNPLEARIGQPELLVMEENRSGSEAIRSAPRLDRRELERHGVKSIARGIHPKAKLPIHAPPTLRKCGRQLWNMDPQDLEVLLMIPAITR